LSIKTCKACFPAKEDRLYLLKKSFGRCWNAFLQKMVLTCRRHVYLWGAAPNPVQGRLPLKIPIYNGLTAVMGVFFLVRFVKVFVVYKNM
jgi:hypothetical protein